MRDTWNYADCQDLGHCARLERSRFARETPGLTMIVKTLDNARDSKVVGLRVRLLGLRWLSGPWTLRATRKQQVCVRDSWVYDDCQGRCARLAACRRRQRAFVLGFWRHKVMRPARNFIGGVGFCGARHFQRALLGGITAH